MVGTKTRSASRTAVVIVWTSVGPSWTIVDNTVVRTGMKSVSRAVVDTVRTSVVPAPVIVMVDRMIEGTGIKSVSWAVVVIVPR